MTLPLAAASSRVCFLSRIANCKILFCQFPSRNCPFCLEGFKYYYRQFTSLYLTYYFSYNGGYLYNIKGNMLKLRWFDLATLFSLFKGRTSLSTVEFALTEWHKHLDTVCPSSLVHLYIATDNIGTDQTSWAYSTIVKLSQWII